MNPHAYITVRSVITVTPLHLIKEDPPVRVLTEQPFENQAPSTDILSIVDHGGY